MRQLTAAVIVGGLGQGEFDRDQAGASLRCGRSRGGAPHSEPSLRIPDAGFQVMILLAHEPWMTGTLVYPDAFWRNDVVGLREAP
jgi:hypothetical protein